MIDRIKEVSDLLEEALEKIGEDTQEDQQLKGIIYIALASYNIGDIGNFSEIASLYSAWLRRKIEGIEKRSMH